MSALAARSLIGETRMKSRDCLAGRLPYNRGMHSEPSRERSPGATRFLREWLARGEDRFVADPWAELLRLKPLVREGNRTAVMHPLDVHLDLLEEWLGKHPETRSAAYRFCNMIIGDPYNPKDLQFAEGLKEVLRRIHEREKPVDNLSESSFPPRYTQRSLFD